MHGLRVFSKVPFSLSNSCVRSRWMSSVPNLRPKPSKEDDMRQLNDFFPTFLAATKDSLRPFRVPSESEWIEKMMLWNLDRVRFPGSTILFNAMRELSGGPDAPPDVLRKAKYLAWCSEMMCCAATIVDDLIDGGEMRWGKPCWHMLPEVRLSAVCDSFVMENLVYQVLRQQFKGTPCYGELLDHCTETTLGTYLGQNDDTHIAKPGRAMEDDFNMSRYEMAARLKTSLMGFYSPVVMALLGSGVHNKSANELAMDISVDLSVILQIEDDFNDCFGGDEMDKSVDIRNGCCTWMILEAKKNANAKQMQILKNNYGYGDKSNVEAVKVIYEELRLKEKLLDYRRQKYALVEAKIEDNAHVLPPNIYRYAVEVMQDSPVEWFTRNSVE